MTNKIETGPGKNLSPDWPLSSKMNYQMPANMLKVKLLHPEAILPTKAYSHALGYDLYSLESKIIHEQTAVDIGIAIELPEGYGAVILDRSSMALRGFFVSGGVIDEDYRGPLMVVLNHMHLCQINKGDKIAQLVLIKTANFPVTQVEELTKSERGEKGFGSSG